MRQNAINWIWDDWSGSRGVGKRLGSWLSACPIERAAGRTPKALQGALQNARETRVSLSTTPKARRLVGFVWPHRLPTGCWSAIFSHPPLSTAFRLLLSGGASSRWLFFLLCSPAAGCVQCLVAPHDRAQSVATGLKGLIILTLVTARELPGDTPLPRCCRPRDRRLAANLRTLPPGPLGCSL